MDRQTDAARQHILRNVNTSCEKKYQRKSSDKWTKITSLQVKVTFSRNTSSRHKAPLILFKYCKVLPLLCYFTDFVITQNFNIAFLLGDDLQAG